MSRDAPLPIEYSLESIANSLQQIADALNRQQHRTPLADNFDACSNFYVKEGQAHTCAKLAHRVPDWHECVCGTKWKSGGVPA